MPAICMCEQAVVVATGGLLRDAGVLAWPFDYLRAALGSVPRAVGEGSREEEEKCSHDAVTSRESKWGFSPHLCSSEWPFFHTDRKSTRLNSSHLGISYAVFC